MLTRSESPTKHCAEFRRAVRHLLQPRPSQARAQIVHLLEEILVAFRPAKRKGLRFESQSYERNRIGITLSGPRGSAPSLDHPVGAQQEG